MARSIDLKPHSAAELAKTGTKKALIEAFNTGLVLLAEPNIFPDANKKLALTQQSLEDIGLDRRGIKFGQLPEGRIRHRFSRTGEDIEFQMGVFTGGVIEALQEQSRQESKKKNDLTESGNKGFFTNIEQIRGHSILESSTQAQVLLLKEHSTPLRDIYDLTSKHPDMQAIVEYYARMAHKNKLLDSVIEPSLAHNEADWKGIVEQLKNESILRLPVEAMMSTEKTGSSRWKKWGCAAIPLFLGGGLLGLVLCNSQQVGQAEVPPVVATATVSGKPPIGIIPSTEGTFGPVIAPQPEVTQLVPDPRHQSESAVSAAECEPAMEVIITEIVRPGDNDASRIYKYPVRVNPAGDSVKGLFEKELATLYARENPYSDEAIRFNLRNQPNEGRNVTPDDQDLAILLDEAKLFYGPDISAAAQLAFIDSIKRNNPNGTLVGDLIGRPEFKAQSPQSIIRRLQELKKS